MPNERKCSCGGTRYERDGRSWCMRALASVDPSQCDCRDALPLDDADQGSLDSDQMEKQLLRALSHICDSRYIIVARFIASEAILHYNEQVAEHG